MMHLMTILVSMKDALWLTARKIHDINRLVALGWNLFAKEIKIFV